MYVCANYREATSWNYKKKNKNKKQKHIVVIILMFWTSTLYISQFTFRQNSNFKDKGQCYGAKRFFQHYFSFIVEGNRRNPPTCRKSLTNFIR